MTVQSPLKAMLLCAFSIAFCVLFAPAQAFATTAPLNVTATSTINTISVSWNPVPGASKYTVYNEYNFVLFSMPVQVGTVSSSTFTFSTSLNSSMKLSVSATDYAGSESNRSTPISVVTIPDTQKPVMNSLTAIGQGPDWNALSWAAPTDNYFGTGSYEVIRDGLQIATTTNFVRAFQDADVDNSVSHNYYVFARDQAGNRSLAAANITTPAFADSSDTLAPTSPSAPTKLMSSSVAISIKWTQSVDNVGTTGYFVYRDGTYLATVAHKPSPATTNSFFDRTVIAGNQYTYQVAAFDAAGHVSPLSIASTFSIVDLNVPSFMGPVAHLTTGSLLTTTIPLMLEWVATDDSASMTLQGAKYPTGAPITSPLVESTFMASSDMTVKAATQTALATPGATTSFIASATDGYGNVGTVSSKSYTPTLVQDTASASLVYSAGWKLGNSPALSGSNTHYSTTAGTTATYTFSGKTDIAWLSRKAPASGIADVYLDNVKVATVDSYSPTVVNKTVLYTARDLNPATTHTLKIVVLGTKNPLASGKRVDLDALIVL